jgi:hypothetical protein
VALKRVVPLPPPELSEAVKFTTVVLSLAYDNFGEAGALNPILFLSLVIILGAALPWWPYSASGRLRHSRAMTAETRTRCAHRGSTPEASQKAAMKLSDDNWETLRREFEERWLAQTTKERRVFQSGIFEGKSFSIFDDGSIEIQTGSGIKEFKDFAELRAVAAANGQEWTGRTEPPDAH